MIAFDSRVPLVGALFVAGCSPGPIAAATSSDDGSATGETVSSETSTSETWTTPQDTPTEEYGTWEGLLELCEPDHSPPWFLYSHFLPCGTEQRWRIQGNPVWPVNGCTAVWLRVSGTLIYDPTSCLYYDNSPPPDHEFALIVDELHDVRRCEPSDCGGAPLCEPERFACWKEYGCTPLQQDCPEGERCITLRYEFDIKPPRTNCVLIADAPLQVGDPCTVRGSWATSHLDECDQGLMCVPFADGDPEGICRAFCDPDGVEGPACNGNCAPCHHGGLCFEDCPECEAVPYC